MRFSLGGVPTWPLTFTLRSTIERGWIDGTRCLNPDLDWQLSQEFGLSHGCSALRGLLPMLNTVEVDIYHLRVHIQKMWETVHCEDPRLSPYVIIEHHVRRTDLLMSQLVEQLTLIKSLPPAQDSLQDSGSILMPHVLGCLYADFLRDMRNIEGPPVCDPMPEFTYPPPATLVRGGMWAEDGLVLGEEAGGPPRRVNRGQPVEGCGIRLPDPVPAAAAPPGPGPARPAHGRGKRRHGGN